MPTNKAWSAIVDRTGTVCSILALIAVFVLQDYPESDYKLLFLWTTTVVIAVAAISTCFTVPVLAVRFIFVILFVVQIPPFNKAWSEIYERDTHFELELVSDQDRDDQIKGDDQNEIKNLQKQNAELKDKWYKTQLFWGAMSHLTGMVFALFACTNAGQNRIRVVYEVS